MRKIKFRGKDMFSGKWLYGAYIPTEFTQWREPSIFDGHHRAEVDGGTLGQYTGFNDFDGTEIYEGDIFRVINEPDVGAMVVRFGENPGTLWGRENYGFYVNFASKRLNEINRQDFLFWYRKSVRVIGNIHDNPELMEETKAKTWFELITASPSSLACFCRDIRCDVGHHNFDDYPPCSEPEEMVKWLMQKTDKKVY